MGAGTKQVGPTRTAENARLYRNFQAFVMQGPAKDGFNQVLILIGDLDENHETAGGWRRWTESRGYEPHGLRMTCILESFPASS